MHEIRATVPPDAVSDVVRLARQAGIERVTVADVSVYGPDAPRRIVSVETSTPKARAFVEGFLGWSARHTSDVSLSSRELRAIVDGADLAQLTRPMSEPLPEVVQDLWQLTHITTSYLGRAAAGAVLLATGIIDDNPVAIVVAALFLPFLSEVLAVSLGLWNRDGKLIVRGIRAIAVSTALAVLAGAAVGALAGGPIRFGGFKSLPASLAISAVIGVTAGLSTVDDTGRRYLIGVAAAVQLAVFPVWLGAAVVIGLPPRDVVTARLAGFVLNLVTIALSSLAAYGSLHRRQL